MSGWGQTFTVSALHNSLTLPNKHSEQQSFGALQYEITSHRPQRKHGAPATLGLTSNNRPYGEVQDFVAAHAAADLEFEMY